MVRFPVPDKVIAKVSPAVASMAPSTVNVPAVMPQAVSVPEVVINEVASSSAAKVVVAVAADNVTASSSSYAVFTVASWVTAPAKAEFSDPKVVPRMIVKIEK